MIRYILLIVFTALILPPFVIAHAYAGQDSAATQHAEVQTGSFEKKRYNVKGHWEVIEIDGKNAIRFKDDFKTKSGPDLKVFLSPKPVSDVTRKTATQGSVNIGVLKSNRGSQTYTLPDDINLKDYESVLIHCEAYSVLWGGFDIPE